MMGERTVMQEALFYEFSIERQVPADHLLRSIDRFVELSGPCVRRCAAPSRHRASQLRHRPCCPVGRLVRRRLRQPDHLGGLAGG